MQATARKTQGTGYRKGNKVTISKWKHPSYSWRAQFIENGKAKDKGFKTKKATEEWSEKHEKEALAQGTEDTLTASERSAVIDTRQRLEALNLDVRAAIEFAAEHFEAAIKSCTVSALKEKVIDVREKAGESERYLQDLRSRLGRFERDFGNRAVTTITTDEIGEWIHGLNLSPVSRNNYRRCLVVMFTDAVESGFATKNPAAKVKPAKVIEGEVGILTPAEIENLLKKAGDAILPAIALGAFAGIRDAEIKRLDWADVDFKKGLIRIRSGVAKSARNRLIPISKNLSAWIQPLAKSSGKIWPSNGRKLHDAVRRSAGYGTTETETEKEKKAGVKLTPWPANALRHSFASYWLAHHQNSSELALHMGHRGTDLIFTSYRALVTPEQAETYWSISPDQPGNIISIAS